VIFEKDMSKLLLCLQQVEVEIGGLISRAEISGHNSKTESYHTATRLTHKLDIHSTRYCNNIHESIVLGKF
jgi:hypothetical protein